MTPKRYAWLSQLAWKCCRGSISCRAPATQIIHGDYWLKGRRLKHGWRWLYYCCADALYWVCGSTHPTHAYLVHTEVHKHVIHAHTNRSGARGYHNGEASYRGCCCTVTAILAVLKGHVWCRRTAAAAERDVVKNPLSQQPTYGFLCAQLGATRQVAVWTLLCGLARFDYLPNTARAEHNSDEENSTYLGSILPDRGVERNICQARCVKCPLWGVQFDWWRRTASKNVRTERAIWFELLLWETTYEKGGWGVSCPLFFGGLNMTAEGACLHTGVHTHRERIYCPQNPLKWGSLRQPDMTLAERLHTPAVPILRDNTREKALGE